MEKKFESNYKVLIGEFKLKRKLLQQKNKKKNQKNENQIGKIIYYKFGLNDIIENQ
jgi:hypothetical protein